MRITLLFLPILFLTFFSYGQITTPVVRANFGVDAELVSDHNVSTTTSGTDDWYHNASLRGTVQFVIDTNGAVALLERYVTDMASRRLSFQKNMRFAIFSVTNNHILLDAAFVRDYHGYDSTVFASGSNKNGDNPSNWTCSVSQGIPDKNDLLDMIVHVRRGGTSSTDSLWIFDGIELSCLCLKQ